MTAIKSNDLESRKIVGNRKDIFFIGYTLIILCSGCYFVALVENLIAPIFSTDYYGRYSNSRKVL